MFALVCANSPARPSWSQTAPEPPPLLALPGVSAAMPHEAETIRGLVRPRHRVALHAPLDGVLGEILVEEGATVEEGQALAVMQNDVQRARVEAANTAYQTDGDLRTARVLLKQAQDRLERTQRAFDRSAATDWELRESKIALEEARAALDTATERRARDKSRLAVENAILDEYTLRAPFDGIVMRIEFDEGASLSTNDVVVEIVGLSDLLAILYLPVERFGSLEEGKTYLLEAEAPISRPLDATLETVDAVLDPGSRTFRAVFRIENPEPRLPAGFHVRLSADAGPHSTQKPSD